MIPVLADMAVDMQKQAQVFIPKAYQMGREKAQSKYGIMVPWTDRDNVSVNMLLNRHAEELQMAMARIEEQHSLGIALSKLLTGFQGRSASWSWALSPALAMGLSTYVDSARTEISRVENLPASDIGIIWYNSEDSRVCPRCLYLSGRWFDAHEAYALAATIHPHCRCSAHFDVGVPSEAMVGPIEGYKPGTAQDIYRDLNLSSVVQARRERSRKPGFGPAVRPGLSDWRDRAPRAARAPGKPNQTGV